MDMGFGLNKCAGATLPNSLSLYIILIKSVLTLLIAQIVPWFRRHMIT